MKKIIFPFSLLLFMLSSCESKGECGYYEEIPETTVDILENHITTIQSGGIELSDISCADLCFVALEIEEPSSCTDTFLREEFVSSEDEYSNRVVGTVTCEGLYLVMCD